MKMEELKLGCSVKGYEGIYFEIGQVWETREGDKLKVKGFDLKAKVYKLAMTEVGDSTEEYYYTLKGEDAQGIETEFDLVKLIPTEATPPKEPQPKTLSEYLKENNAYEAFIENCVEDFLNDINVYNEIKRDSKEGSIIGLGAAFNWYNTKQGSKYWSDLYYNKPENFVYDMDEIIFAEVDKRIAEQKTQSEVISTEEFDQMFEQKAPSKYMVFVEGKSSPKKIHTDLDTAEEEAKRLATQEIGSKVFLVEIVKEYKSRLEIDEL